MAEGLKREQPREDLWHNTPLTHTHTHITEQHAHIRLGGRAPPCPSSPPAGRGTPSACGSASVCELPLPLTACTHFSVATPQHPCVPVNDYGLPNKSLLNKNYYFAFFYLHFDSLLIELTSLVFTCFTGVFFLPVRHSPCREGGTPRPSGWRRGCRWVCDRKPHHVYVQYIVHVCTI